MLSARNPGSDTHATIYVGAMANLFATGCRECLRFLVQNSLIDVIVVSGGALEHDIRRAISPECYTIAQYASEERLRGAVESSGAPELERIGNIRVSRSDEYDQFMAEAIHEIAADQAKRRQKALDNPPAEEDRVCSWSDSPSTFWEQVADKMVDRIGQERASTSVLYWARRVGVKIFSPSFADGDVVNAISNAQRQSGLRLRIDLVGDINLLNRTAVRAKRTGMLVLGGGVVKHHVCNANLMRNGADWSIFVNNGQEFDGSDAGARPDEAVSWGKIRLDGKSVKVYAEITSVLPLLVAEACLPFALKDPE